MVVKYGAFDVQPMRLFQSVLWKLLALWFGLVVTLYFLHEGWAEDAATAGLAFLLVAIPIRVIVMAEQFRRARLHRLALLSYLLLVLLAGTAVVKTVLP